MSTPYTDATAGRYANPTADKAINRMTAGEYVEKIEHDMSEYSHQKRLFEETGVLASAYTELKYLHAIPNGEYRPKSTGGKLRAAGVKSGVPDMCLPVARGGYHGLYIELKSLKHGARTSNEQNRWIDTLRENGYRAAVCYGWRSALNEILRYLGV